MTAAPAGESGAITTGLVATAAVLVLTTAIAADGVVHHDLGRFAWSALLHGAVFGIVAWRLMTRPARPSDLWLILAVAVLLRGIAMTVPHNVLTTDALRYVWDGRIQWSGFNPFLYAPADERLAHLRDAVIYPGINQKETAVTIYPPMAQLVFMAAVRITDGIAGVQLIMAAFEALTIWALMAFLQTAGQPRERVILYAWHPLPIWELSSQGHIDSATIALLICAIVAAQRRSQGAAGALLAAAALTKFYPALIGAALWRRWRLTLPLAFVAVAVLLYLPYWWTAGSKVLGFLNRHLDNEGYWAGWGFHIIWILRDLKLADPSAWTYIAPAAVMLAVLLLWALLARTPDALLPDRMLLIAFAFVWATSPHYPWYFAWVAALAVLSPRPSAIAFTVLPLLFYMPYPWGTQVGSLIYVLIFGVPLLMLALEIWRDAQRGRRAEKR